MSSAHPLTTDLNPARPGDRFNGLFADGSWGDPQAGALLDHGPARKWLALVEQADRSGHYTFQAPLEGRTGPRVLVDGKEMLLLSSYDYLGLVGHPRIEAASVDAIRRFGTGTGGVRLLTGTNTLHKDLEKALAEFKEAENALVFTSGYLANLAAVTSLFGPKDRVIMDELSHRSLMDGCRLARVPFQRFRHNDVDHLEEILRIDPGGRTLIIVEGVYSMDGDICPLREIVQVKDRYGAFLMVDEAHSLGVLGERGRGVHEELGVPPKEVDLWTGSLSKAIPAGGGYVAGRSEVMAYVQHGAAPFMFSSALGPAATAAALEALAVLEEEPHRVEMARTNASGLRDGLRAQGWDLGRSQTPVIPVIVGGLGQVLEVARDLWLQNVMASAIVPPAVDPGGSRLRICATAAMDSADVEMALSAFARILELRKPESTVPAAPGRVGTLR